MGPACWGSSQLEAGKQLDQMWMGNVDCSSASVGHLPMKSLGKKVKIPQQFHKNFWNLFLLSPLLRLVQSQQLQQQDDSSHPTVLLFLQLSRCALNGIPIALLGMGEKAGNK